MAKYLLIIFLLFIATIAQAKDVTLHWDPSPTPTVTGYIVYWDNQPNPPFINSVDCGLTLTKQVSDLPNAEDQYFAVAAYDANNNISTYSNIVKSDKIVAILPELDLDISWEFIQGK